MNPINEEQLVELLFEHDFKVDQLPEAYRADAAKLAETLQVLDHDECPELPTNLKSRTLDFIDEHEDSSPIAILPQGGGRLRIAELVAIAAMLLIAVAIGWPIMNYAQAMKYESIARANLGQVAHGFQQYAEANQGQMPMTSNGLGDNWWGHGSTNDAGAANSNSAHLFLLPKQDYIKATALNSPTNIYAPIEIDKEKIDWQKPEHISYSYQNQLDGKADSLKQAVRPILADKNPYFSPASHIQLTNLKLNSQNHKRLNGQHVIFSDGTVRWLKTPVLKNGDHIFLKNDGRSLKQYKGNETSDKPIDSFLVW